MDGKIFFFFLGGGGVKILDLSTVQLSNNYHICNILDWGQKFIRLP